MVNSIADLLAEDSSADHVGVAQAQHAVRDLTNLLKSKGIEVEFGIHPVAGRMPGHMNVLLAEAEVPYEQLREMDDINPRMENVDVAIVIGANPTENHPVAATFFKRFAKRGGKLIVMDPRGQALKRHATHMLQFRPGGDVSLLNAIMNVIVEEKLYDRQYIEGFTEGFFEFRDHIRAFPPERMAELCGIDAETLRTVGDAISYMKKRAAESN